jgi:replicative DNA helicase
MAILQRREEIILNQLIHNEPYLKKVIPHLKPEYFDDRVENILFDVIKKHVVEYNSSPAIDIISVTINKMEGIAEDDNSTLNMYIDELLSTPSDAEYVYTWLVDMTESFCKERAMYNAVLESFNIFNGEEKLKKIEGIPDIMRDALRVSFDNNIGLDYDDAEEKWRLLHEEIDRVPFDIEALNIITKGGLGNKTLNCILAGTGVGKTIFMCHYAASSIAQGKNVLYITLEMSEVKIAERIDANLMNVKLDDIRELPKNDFVSRFKKVLSFGGFLGKFFKKKKLGKLIIKEYPTSGANVNHFRNLLDELSLKKGFIPDVIIIDYLNICASSRITLAAGSYTYIKSIAEELRGMAVEQNVPILTGTQTNRGGFSSSDVEMGDTAESFGLPHTLDLFIAIMTNEALEKMGRVLCKQLKNRYGDVAQNRYFTLGLDKPKMRYYHVDDWNAGIGDEDKENMPDLPEEDIPLFEQSKDTKSAKEVSIKKKKFSGVKF